MSEPGHVPGRVSAACARCRRQKLKCDAVKPCTMCVRSGMKCQPRSAVPDTSPSHTPPKRRKVSGTQHQSQVSPGEQVSPMSRHSGADPGEAQTQQFGANRSTISLAMNMYQSLGTQAPANSATIPGDASPSATSHPVWTLKSMRMPPRHVMEALVATYFDKMHWFIWILHEPSFTRQLHDILSAAAWRREDRAKILVTLTVAAIGLKCAIQNTSPGGQEMLRAISPDPQGLMTQMIDEIKLHIIDLMDDSCIETVQVTVLLGAFYIFHGSPTLAWAMIGMAVRASYGLALHCTSDDEDEDSIETQLRRRCWNHITVADTFASQIYGRPASLDPAFSGLLPMAQADDTMLQVLPGTASQTGDDGEDRPVTALTFHWLKYKLYEITRETLATFRLLRLHTPMTFEDLRSLIDAVQRIEGRLADWRRSLPSPFNADDLSDPDNPTSPFPRLFDDQAENPALRRLRFQAWLLQNTYDAAVIHVHRPLLEYRMSADYRRPGMPPTAHDAVNRAFDVSVQAALRISRTPAMQFEHEFCLAFIFLHLFTAGVILCIPPTSHPYSAVAQDAKAGVFRIIQAAKALRPHTPIARHAEQLLSDLLKLSLHREVDMAFKEERAAAAGGAGGSGASTAERQDSVPPRGSETTGTNGDATVTDQTSISETSASISTRQQYPDAAGGFGDQWTEESYMMNGDGSDFQALDLPLDEAFGAFGQVMFNLMPDDPLNNWGWGKGSM